MFSDFKPRETTDHEHIECSPCIKYPQIEEIGVHPKIYKSNYETNSEWEKSSGQKEPVYSTFQSQ